MGWQYRQLDVQVSGFWELTGRIPDRAIQDLNRLGKEGWEVIQVVPLARGLGGTERVSFIMKRQIE